MSPDLHSSLYEGVVRHRRHGSVPHAFRYRLCMLYLDLDELEQVFAGRWLWSLERANVASFRRSDYLGDPRVPLKEAVLQRVEEELGVRPEGPVRMLTHPRYLGYCFNPVTFYYCFDAGGESLTALVAEITNTPWDERHAYVLGAERGRRAQTWRFAKAFHVSPFFDMDHDYLWRCGVPGERLAIHMQNHVAGERVFDATLRLERRPLGAGSLARALVRFPLMTGQVAAAIYWQAFRLWWKNVPFFVHPRHRPALSTAESP